ncbi:MAG: LamG-like jellyroll fold domain-containing protein [Bacteroidia bacterium]
MNDWSGWNNPGISPQAVYTLDRNGGSDKALLLSGIYGHMDVPTKNIRNPIYTYSQWLRLDQKPDLTGFVVFQLGDSSCFQTLSVYPASGDSVILDYRFGKPGQDSVLQFGVRMPVQSWNYVTILRSRDSVYCFYNAFFSIEKYAPGNACVTGQTLRYGKNLQGTQGFIGAIDEVRVYSENIEPSFLFDVYISEKLGLGSEETTISLYPNPCMEKVFIEWELEMKTLILYNGRGEAVLTRQLQNEKHLELILTLAPGVYFISLLGENGIRSTEKLIISVEPE